MNTANTTPTPLSETQKNVLKVLSRDGFVTIPNLWEHDQLSRLISVCSKFMAEQPVKHWGSRPAFGKEFRLPIFEDKNWAVLSNLSGLSDDFDTFLEELLSDRYLRPILDVILGKGYKIWETSIRRSQIANGGLALHQDSVGEFGLSILLTDISDSRGTTVFLKGSHRYPVSCRESGLDQFSPSFIQPFLSPAVGKAGDIVLFYKNVWHGRTSCKIPKPQDAILMSFIASGYDYQSFDVPQELLSKLPSETSSMLNPYCNTRLLQSGRRLVESPQPQEGRLIDDVYQMKPWDVHPSQLLRIFGPVGSLKRRARFALGKFRASKSRGGNPQ